MKKATIIIFLLFLATPLRAQTLTSNALPFTAFTPTPPAIASLGGLSPKGAIDSGQVLKIIGSGFSSGCNVNINGAVQPGSSVLFVSATEIDYTVQASVGSPTGTANLVTVSCNAPVLAFDVAPSVVLPNGTIGAPYSADLGALAQVSGGVPPYSFSLTTGALPAGLALSTSGILSGTPSGTGSFNFTYTVSDSSGSARTVSTVTVASNGKPTKRKTKASGT